MTAVFIIATLGVMLLGFFVMKRIDAFIDGGGIIDSPQGRLHAGFLVFGAPGDAELIRKYHFRCAEMDMPNIPEDEYYSALFTLSENDMENIQACHAAKANDPGIFVIARCHKSELYEIYKDAGADYILSGCESIKSILAELREMQHEK